MFIKNILEAVPEMIYIIHAKIYKTNTVSKWYSAKYIHDCKECVL